MDSKPPIEKDQTPITNQIWTIDGLIDRFDLPFNRFFIFLSLAILLATILGTIGLKIYDLSDAASLDLSRPGYQKVRTETNKSQDSPTISPDGQVDTKFKLEVESAVAYHRGLVGANAFSEAPLLDENLINPDPISL